MEERMTAHEFCELLEIDYDESADAVRADQA